MRLVPVFDLDGTLLDSDEALIAAFTALGVDRSAVGLGHLLADECGRLGIEVDDYLAAYDDERAQPFEGVVELLAALGRWAVCSNKHPRGGHAELARLGWEPEVVLFSDAFAGSKQLAPVLEALELDAAAIVFVGDTSHDRSCAAEVGARFVLAGWNPRATAVAGDLVAHRPVDLWPMLEA
jgi:HAD superfamily hydrolase (TIGR01549 family)